MKLLEVLQDLVDGKSITRGPVPFHLKMEKDKKDGEVKISRYYTISGTYWPYAFSQEDFAYIDWRVLCQLP
jgi:hypothetical protein